MCAPSQGGGVLVGILSSPAAAVGVTVVGSGAVLAAWAGGSTLLAWAVIGLTAWASIATIVLLAVLARPVQSTAPTPAPAPVAVSAQRVNARILHARPAQTITPATAPAIEAARPQAATTTTTRVGRIRWS